MTISKKIPLLTFLSLFLSTSPLFAAENIKELKQILKPLNQFKNTKSICDGRDDRRLSNKRPIGRLRGCTLTMIGSACAITAGHCSSTFSSVEFNTSDSSSGFEDLYLVDRESIVYKDNGIGDDWAVLRLKRNAITDKWPGDVQGSLPIAQRRASVGDIIQITGYGTSSRPTRNFEQQTHEGEITKFSRGGVRGFFGFFTGEQYAVMEHRADTTGGNSGSTVVNQATGEVIGIHTHGGCRSRGKGANSSTEILRNKAFKKAINRCLAWERRNL